MKCTQASAWGPDPQAEAWAHFGRLLLFLLLLLATFASAQLPTPRSITTGPPVQYDASYKIDNSIRRFATVVRAFATDWNVPQSPTGTPLRIREDSALGEEEYRLEIADRVTVSASTATGMAWGLHSLGQLLPATRQMVVRDKPDVPFRCLMVDVARRHHSPSTLRTLIRWCQAGKVRYLQLHLTDDQNWMFPTKTLAGVDKNNQHGQPAYTERELLDLQAFASDRGVALIPEIDVPGHSSLLTKLDPALFRIQGSESAGCIDFASPEVRTKIKSLMREVATLFPDAPYIHLGGDEAWYPNAERDPDMAAAIARLGQGATPNTVFVEFVAEMAEEILRLKRVPIVWEGFRGSAATRARIPKETVVVAWEGHYYPADRLTEDRYPVVNAGWDPYYVVNHFPYEMFTLVPLHRLYQASPTRFGIVNWPGGKDPAFEWKQPEQVVGSMLCWWEGREWNAQKILPSRIAAFGCRMWNAKGEQEFAEFGRRFESLAAKVRLQAHPFALRTSGGLLTDPDEFEDSLSIALTPHEFGVRMAWRTDGRAPTHADLQQGFTVSVKETAVVAIQAFRDTTPVGETLFHPVTKVKVVPNLAFGRPVEASSPADPQFEAWRVTDGVGDHLSAYWLAYPNPVMLTIDLGRIEPLTRIEVVAFWATGNPTHYRLSLSEDGVGWNEVVDASKQTEPTTREGYAHRFPATMARFVRVETLGGPLFPPTMTRINEIRVFADDGGR